MELRDHLLLSLVLLHSSLGLNLSSPKNGYLRWRSSTDLTGRSWALQTSVLTLEHCSDGRLVELHAQVHFGSKEYFQFYNLRQFWCEQQAVLYELLVEDDLLQDGRLETPIMASAHDQALAASYGWTCQADVIDYTQPNWRHADLTRDQFGQRLGTQRTTAAPLWQQATATPIPAAAGEAATALMIGPPPTTGVSAEARRSQLLPATETLVGGFRGILWWMVPSPELSVLLLDWSVYTGGLSMISLPLVESLLSGRWDIVRQLVFGQVVVSLSKQTLTDKLLIDQRNERAMECLSETPAKRVAILYGCNHCRDLQQRLQAQGFVAVDEVWRTVWSVTLPPSSPSSLAWPIVLLLPLYFVVGGLDWLVTWQAVLDGDAATAAMDAVAYLVRHVLLYVGLSKFLVDWNTR